MQLLNGLYLALLGWQMYTPTHSSPLSLASTPTAINLDLVPEPLPTLGPAANAVTLDSAAQIPSLPSPAPNPTNGTLAGGGFPPDPCIIRLPGSSVTGYFFSRQYLKENRVQQVLKMAQIDCNQHNPAQAMYKFVPTRYSAGKTTLKVPSRYQGDLKWGQWSLALDALRAYMELWGFLGCEFDFYDHIAQKWYYDGFLMVDFMQNATTVQNETVTATE